MEKTCIVCKKIFIPRHPKTQTCSSECYEKLHTLICIVCKKEFFHNNIRKKICSYECLKTNKQKILKNLWKEKNYSYKEFYEEKYDNIILQRKIARKGKPLSESTKKKISIKTMGRKMSDTHRLTMSIVNKGNKYNIGRKASLETRKKMSESMLKLFKKVEYTCPLCKKISYIRPSEKKTKKYCSRICANKALQKSDLLGTCIYCNKKFHVRSTFIKKKQKYCSRKCTLTAITKNRYEKRFLYNNTLFRSRWEISFAKWCDENNIKWEYEKQTFEVSPNLFYMPDFYLEQHNLWVEIKGYWGNRSKEKCEKFSLTHRLLIIDKDGINKIDWIMKNDEIIVENYIRNEYFAEQFCNGDKL